MSSGSFFVLSLLACSEMPDCTEAVCTSGSAAEGER